MATAGDDYTYPHNVGGVGGLTKREFMATHILTGLVVTYQGQPTYDQDVITAVQLADALINQLNQPVTQK